jgi:hypothetical protein
MPNIVAFLLLPVGGPDFTWPIALCGLLALALTQLPGVATRRICLGLLFFLSCLLYVSLSFNLLPSKALDSLPYLLELKPMQAPEYIVAACVLVAALVATLRYGPHQKAPRGIRQIAVTLAGLALLINIDGLATAGVRGGYKMAAPAGTPFESAVLDTGLTPDRERGRNVIVVIVESLGVPSNPADKALFDRIWNKQAWSARYDVSEGVTPYYGSTTTAEMRELCGLWADVPEVDFGSTRCLPWKFRDAGFRTVAMHSFDGAMFQRQSWYPKVGFEKRLFMDDLLKLHATRCSGIFDGVCDRDVPHIIGNYLRANSDKPNFVYWLTLNAHLPVPTNGSLETADCRLGDADLDRDFPSLCRNYAIHKQVADALTAEIMRPDFPDADILIVGDHMPPYFERSIRQRFDQAHVPWIMLRRRSSR